VIVRVEAVSVGTTPVFHVHAGLNALHGRGSKVGCHLNSIVKIVNNINIAKIPKIAKVVKMVKIVSILLLPRVQAYLPVV
jgi:hypothetical protein